MASVFPHGAAAAVSLSFDDARPSQLEGVSILDAHGVRATFYVLPAQVAAARERWLRVVRTGHEIGNHTVTHPCSGNYPFSRGNALEDTSLAELAADIDRASQAIETLLGVRPRSFAYPCGQSFIGRGSRRRSYVPLVAARFAAGRGYRSETANAPDRCDLAHVEAFSIDGLDADALRALVEGGVALGEWVVLAGHDIGTGGSQTVLASALDRLCGRLAGDERVWVAPVVQVAGHLARRRAEEVSADPVDATRRLQ